MSAILKGAIVASALAAASACASSQAGVRPEAFPRSRPADAGVNDSVRSGSMTQPAPIGNTREVLPESGLAANPATTLSASPIAAPAAPVAAVLETAFNLIGTPYFWGGQTPETGFDCSGFVRYVLRQHAIQIPRTTAEQFGAGRSVAQDEIQPGDLVFFSTTGPGATHVGLVVSSGSEWKFVHAPADGSSVRIERFDTGYWQQRWLGARRMF